MKGEQVCPVPPTVIFLSYTFVFLTCPIWLQPLIHKFQTFRPIDLPLMFNKPINMCICIYYKSVLSDPDHLPFLPPFSQTPVTFWLPHGHRASGFHPWSLEPSSLGEHPMSDSKNSRAVDPEGILNTPDVSRPAHLYHTCVSFLHSSIFTLL